MSLASTYECAKRQVVESMESSLRVYVGDQVFRCCCYYQCKYQLYPYTICYLRGQRMLPVCSVLIALLEFVLPISQACIVSARSTLEGTRRPVALSPTSLQTRRVLLEALVGSFSFHTAS